MVSSAGAEAAALAATAGLELDPWQRHVLDVALGEQRDGKWSALQVGLDVPRQNGKGSILEARELAGLFLFDERLQVHTAHQFATALEAFRRVLLLIESTPDLSRQVRRVVRSHGEEGIELRSGARLLFRARSNGAGRGLSGDLVVLDEAMYLTPEVMSALMPTLSARPNPQLWLTGSAGFGSSQVWQAFRRRAAQGDPGRYCWLGWGNERDRPLEEIAADPDALRRANPALGVRLSAEFAAAERGGMTLDAYCRERLGVWDEDLAAGGGPVAVIPAEMWAACADPRSEAVGPVCFAVDMRPDRGAVTIVAAGASRSGGVHVEVVDQRAGTGWVAARVGELVSRWSPKAVVVDPGAPAGSLLPALRDALGPSAGVLREVTLREMAQACGGLVDAVTQRRLSYRGGFVGLDAAIAAGEARAVGDVWVWSRRGPVDVCPLVAASLAVWAVTAVTAPMVGIGAW